MRILVVTQYFWPENFRINDLVQALSERGHQITILTGEPNYPSGKIFPDYLANKTKFNNFQGSHILRVPVFLRKNNRFSLFLSYLSFVISASTIGIWKLRKKPFDIIFVYEPSPITVGIPAVLVKKIKKTPIVFWVLDLWPNTLQAVGIIKTQILLNLIGGIVKFIYTQCDLILAQSRSFIEHIKHYSPTNITIEYFPNWAESIFDCIPSSSAPEIIKKSDEFIIMFAGNLGEAQDFPAILTAAELLRPYRNIRWIFLGDGRMREWIVKEINRRELKDCIELLGLYPIERMPEFFMHSDALLVTLMDDLIFASTIPGKLQSYIAAGIPVLGMLNGEASEIINENKIGICVPSGASSELARAILDLIALSPKNRAEMGARGREFYDKQFSRDSLINKLEDFLLLIKNKI